MRSATSPRIRDGIETSQASDSGLQGELLKEFNVGCGSEVFESILSMLIRFSRDDGPQTSPWITIMCFSNFQGVTVMLCHSCDSCPDGYFCYFFPRQLFGLLEVGHTEAPMFATLSVISFQCSPKKGYPQTIQH